ncbi:HAMP domain-containing sensor histidine kinase [Kitasatospora sp. LaBMicrA B282]|uniref:ATP-binding protein n=1 Tax=Kitasatospora sp. LaBMicrA B282 TaxID=3420949 RepID=UPI003D1273F4
MTRRIALTVSLLVVVLLVLAVVPLGVLLTDREQTAFRGAAADATRSISAAAEEHLSDGKSDEQLRRLLDQAQRDGGCAAVYDAHGQQLARTSCPTATGGPVPALVAAVLAHPDPQQTRNVRTDDRLTVAAPVGDGDDAVGVAVLARSTDSLDDRITVIWGWLALIGVAGLLGGTLVSVRLARWVGRPLHEVDLAARRLGEGDLAARAPAGRGPQEVRRLAATFNTMAARTEALVHGHRAVIADVSHQLRTPLAALRLRLDLLADAAADRPAAAGGSESGGASGGGLGSEAAADLAGAQEEIARLSRLVDGLLAAARAESAVPRPVAVRPAEVAGERVAAWEPLATERRVTLSVHCPPRLVAWLGAGDLEQVLDNLLANALDAVPAGGRVRIEGAARDGDTVLLRVVDNGPGMTAAARRTAFRRFGNPEATGTGLGLAIVHRLVTANGGSARLTDTPGRGLTVELELPAARSTAG